MIGRTTGRSTGSAQEWSSVAGLRSPDGGRRMSDSLTPGFECFDRSGMGRPASVRVTGVCEVYKPREEVLVSTRCGRCSSRFLSSEASASASSSEDRYRYIIRESETRHDLTPPLRRKHSQTGVRGFAAPPHRFASASQAKPIAVNAVAETARRKSDRPAAKRCCENGAADGLSSRELWGTRRDVRSSHRVSSAFAVLHTGGPPAFDPRSRLTRGGSSHRRRVSRPRRQRFRGPISRGGSD